jgi:ABC-type branched-subunit amino acid transport system ATPase component
LAEIQPHWHRCANQCKSTRIRTLLDHVSQRDGHITLFGKDASRFKPHEVARLCAQGAQRIPEKMPLALVEYA